MWGFPVMFTVRNHYEVLTKHFTIGKNKQLNFNKQSLTINDSHQPDLHIL